MPRPSLTPVPLAEVVPLRPGFAYITMAEGQWDEALRSAYERGWILLELDDREQPVRAFASNGLPAGARLDQRGSPTRERRSTPVQKELLDRSR